MQIVMLTLTITLKPALTLNLTHNLNLTKLCRSYKQLCFEQRKHAASAAKVRTARKRTAEPDEEPRAKQPKLQLSGSAVSHSVPQSRVDQLIIDFVINYMEPMSVVEEPAFIDLVTGLQPTRTVMTRKTLDGKPLFMIRLCILFHALNAFGF